MSMSNINPDSIDTVKALVSDMLTKMGVRGKITARLSEYKDQETVAVNISTDDAKILIGQAGEHLMALQHVARLLFKKQHQVSLPFMLDVNNYKREKEEKLQSLARSVALKVRRTGEKEVLNPMSSYDRFVIHNFLANEEDLSTESYGEEPERRLVVKLAGKK